ncbi:hypothetical protein ACHAWO_000542 [Cyclotella atomus]|uniref:Uncharacterized protein n=1 Tax=Cyclotella atomus TaxID=382360 RepID=A0ABD3P2D1_9STRA
METRANKTATAIHISEIPTGTAIHKTCLNCNDSHTKNQVQTNDNNSTTQNNRTSLPPNNYESSSCIPPRVSDVSSNSCFGSSNTVSQGTQQHLHQAAALRNIQPRVSPSNPPAVTPATAKKASTINSSIQSINPSPNKGSESFSFSELKSHLVQLSQNRGFYEANYGKTFVVPCKLKNGKEEKRVFNTVKDKKGSKKGDKKYEFLLHSYFYGPKSSDGHIACRIQSSLMEPYFSGHTPSDIRKLQKTEKERAVKLVNDSSTQFLHEFASLAEIHIKLMYRPDEFFAKIGSLGDGWVEVLEDPLLIVVDRKTGYKSLVHCSVKTTYCIQFACPTTQMQVHMKRACRSLFIALKEASSFQ